MTGEGGSCLASSVGCDTGLATPSLKPGVALALPSECRLPNVTFNLCSSFGFGAAPSGCICSSTPTLSKPFVSSKLGTPLRTTGSTHGPCCDCD